VVTVANEFRGRNLCFSFLLHFEAYVDNFAPTWVMEDAVTCQKRQKWFDELAQCTVASSRYKLTVVWATIYSCCASNRNI